MKQEEFIGHKSGAKLFRKKSWEQQLPNSISTTCIKFPEYLIGFFPLFGDNLQSVYSLFGSQNHIFTFSVFLQIGQRREREREIWLVRNEAILPRYPTQLRKLVLVAWLQIVMLIRWHWMYLHRLSLARTFLLLSKLGLARWKFSLDILLLGMYVILLGYNLWVSWPLWECAIGWIYQHVIQAILTSLIFFIALFIIINLYTSLKQAEVNLRFLRFVELVGI